MAGTLDELASQVRAALSSGDIDDYRDLLAPDARWGAPDAPEWGCHNRDDIVAWYKAARRNGMSAEVDEVVAGHDALLVGLTVRVPGQPDEARRWQVLTVAAGLVTDICGFDTRAEAATRAGLPG